MTEYVIGSNIINCIPQVLEIHLYNNHNLSACASCKSGADLFVPFTNMKLKFLRREKMRTLFNQTPRKDEQLARLGRLIKDLIEEISMLREKL
ncbi:hypothetical protein CN367_00620 [Priestia megaterium]|nr:hypothetical protein CN367_00620 [Priestia megaterium]PFL64174.1 hypothetical protein COJ36_21280 [Priestia megaterium]